MKEKELHQAILDIVNNEKENNPVTYNTEMPYQSYERINFEGLRWSVEKRIKEYGLEVLYDHNARYLDIGSNFGFFVVEFAHHCKEAHGVEPNAELNKIGKLTAEYLGLSEKTKFFDLPFNELSEDTKYDRITSLAAFYTSDKNERSAAEEYFKKIDRLLAPRGIFFYESTSFPLEDDSPDKGHYLASVEAEEVISEIFDVKKSYQAKSGAYHRRFMLTEKK
ncbi:MAG: methyltransferase domain-containing protein [Bdellovibrionota bacterium]